MSARRHVRMEPMAHGARPMSLPMSVAMAGRAGGGASPLLTDLVAYWDLNELSGDRADSSGNGYLLTDNNTVGNRSGVGGVGTAADFVAANTEYLSNSGDSGLWGVAGEPWSMHWWFYADDLAAQRTMVATLASGGASGFDAFWAAGGTLRFRQRHTGLYTLIIGSISAGQWYSLYVAYNGTDTLTGVLNDGAPATLSVSGAFVPGTQPFLVGALPGAALPMDGGMQCVGRWGRELTASEITWLAGAARSYADVEAYTG